MEVLSKVTWDIEMVPAQHISCITDGKDRYANSIDELQPYNQNDIYPTVTLDELPIRNSTDPSRIDVGEYDSFLKDTDGRRFFYRSNIDKNGAPILDEDGDEVLQRIYIDKPVKNIEGSIQFDNK